MRGYPPQPPRYRQIQTVMAITSIHFIPVKGGSEEHNKREKQLDYLIEGRSHLNEYWEKDSQKTRLKTITQNFLSAHPSRKKLNSRATPIREAAVVIDEKTTMDDLKRLSKRLYERFGLDIFQIAIHRDEGYMKAKDKMKLNLHAHLVADWTDQRGETLKLSPQDTSEMQTICAEVLGMERGKSSEKKHLSAIQFKIAAEEKRVEMLDVEVEKLQVAKARKEVAIASAKAVGEAIMGLVGQSSKDKEISALKTTISGEPQRIAAAVATAKAEERQQVLSEVKKAANLCIKEKNGRETAEDIGKAWRRRFREVSELESNLKSIRANIKTQIESATDEYRRRAERAEERAELWKDRFLDVWPTAEKAIAAIVEKVNSSWQRFFTPEQVKDIQAAMESAVDTEDRIERGKQLMEYARPEFTKCELNTAEQVEDIAINSSNVRTQSIGRSI